MLIQRTKTHFFVVKNGELSIYPFVYLHDKEFVKINANEIKVPCTKCGGECHRYNRIQCDECDKWTHQVCSSLTKEEFINIGKSTDPFICSKKCEMKTFPFNNLSYRNFLQRDDELPFSELTPKIVAKQGMKSEMRKQIQTNLMLNAIILKLMK